MHAQPALPKTDITVDPGQVNRVPVAWSGEEGYELFMSGGDNHRLRQTNDGGARWAVLTYSSRIALPAPPETNFWVKNTSINRKQHQAGNAASECRL